MKELGCGSFHELLKAHRYQEIAAHAVRIESRTNLLFSFEKIALRDATRSRPGAKRLLKLFMSSFTGAEAKKHDSCDGASRSNHSRVGRHACFPGPSPQCSDSSRNPKRHFFLKPNVTRLAAVAYGFDLPYRSHPDGKPITHF
jgi:hypothetical protein